MIWVWLKIKRSEGQTAGFCLCFHLPGFHFGTGATAICRPAGVLLASHAPKGGSTVNPLNGREATPAKRWAMVFSFLFIAAAASHLRLASALVILRTQT